MSIPTEAIEAAARALSGDTKDAWDAAPTHAKDTCRWTAEVALTAAAPLIAAEAVRAELMEVALMLEPFSGIGLANGATRMDVSNWLRARANQLEGKSE